MGAKIDAELSEQLREAQRAEPTRQIPVIVTLSADTEIAALERCGLTVHGRVESISVVYGTVAASAVSALEALDSVARIEYDGRAWALGGSRA